jgi:hypothetical protein
VTPKYRQNLYHYVGIGLMLPIIVGLGIGIRHGSGFLITVGVIALLAELVIAGVSLATSRCPHCDRFIDLRGRSAYCPRCGQWLPLREGNGQTGGG